MKNYSIIKSITKISSCLLLLINTCLSKSYSINFTQDPPIKTRILFLLDASGSMTNPWGSSNRFRISKAILSTVVDSLEQYPNIEMGLRVFGSSSALNLNDCKDTQLESPIKSKNASDIKAKLNTLRSKGITPIAYSLEQCEKDFSSLTGKSRNIIILITDGVESCSGNACEVSKKLQQKGIILQPFIIGLGLTKEAAATFDCMGRYDDATNETDFKKAIKNAINIVLSTTSTQINLLDKYGNPTESNVPITLYDHLSKIIHYHFIHTLNPRSIPDTLQIDPVNTYDIVIHTLPPIERNNIQITANTHNNINIPCVQGDLLLQIEQSGLYRDIPCILKKVDSDELVDILSVGTKKRYLSGTYNLEISTLPRINLKNINIRSGETTIIKIPTPGMATIINASRIPTLGSIYNETASDLEWICNINENSSSETITLQPGNYRLVYKSKGSKRAMTTREEKFKIISGASILLKL